MKKHSVNCNEKESEKIEMHVHSFFTYFKWFTPKVGEKSMEWISIFLLSSLLQFTPGFFTIFSGENPGEIWESFYTIKTSEKIEYFNQCFWVHIFPDQLES